MLSLDKFLALVERSGLVERDRLAQVVAEWKGGATLIELSDAQYCAAHLVERQVLTPWQCKKLLDGRHRGFYLGKYKLLDHLGSGGMSSVYLAEHTLMQRLVAIKVLPQNKVTDAAYLARFLLEGQAAAALDHPNIVRAYDLDSVGQVHYLVMEYVDGRDLNAIVCHEGPLDYHAAADYIAQACVGLAHAHQCGLVHRDIKPANLLVDRKRTVKILDMGLAKFTPPAGRVPVTAADEHVLGTADYLAPEQAVNSTNVDGRADIYSLGCTLYFLLTGHPPFAEGTSLERMTAHQQQVPPSIMLDRPDAPAGLVAICRRMMEKSPENRYQSATEVESALREWITSDAAAAKTRQPAYAGVSSARPTSPSSPAIDSGSGVKPQPPASSSDESRGSSALAETDPNLHRATVRIPRSLLGTSESSHHLGPGSEVLPLGISPRRGSTPGARLDEPIAPPVDIPPVPAPRAPLMSVAALPAMPTEFLPEDGMESPLDAVPSESMAWGSRTRLPSGGAGASWVFVACVLAFAALVIVLLLLASGPTAR